METNTQKKILIVEDDQDILDILQYILTDAGYSVQRSHGDGVVVQIGRTMPDLILLDHKLQVAWGSEISKELKASPVTCHIPIIMTSAALHLEETASEAGADDYLVKPFDMKDVLDVVARWLDKATEEE